MANKEIRHAGSASRGFRCAAAASFCAPDEGRAAGTSLLALAAIYEGATRTEASKIGGVTLQIVRDWVVKFNAQGPDGLDRQEGARPGFAAERYASGGARQGHRRRTHPGDPWCGALAARRSLPMGFRGVPRLGLRADAQPRAASARLSQALRSSAPSCPGRGRDRGF